MDTKNNKQTEGVGLSAPASCSEIIFLAHMEDGPEGRKSHRAHWLCEWEPGFRKHVDVLLKDDATKPQTTWSSSGMAKITRLKNCPACEGYGSLEETNLTGHVIYEEKCRACNGKGYFPNTELSNSREGDADVR